MESHSIGWGEADTHNKPSYITIAIINKVIGFREKANVRLGFMWSARSTEEENDQKHSKQRWERVV